MNNIDTLVIIGNGFDIWQKLDTSYFRFKEYLLAHIDNIMDELQIDKIIITGSKGKRTITPVEIVYGKSLELKDLKDDFWRCFESSLGKIDAQYLNLFFDKEDEDLEWMLEVIEDARRIFEKAFNDWVKTLNVEDDRDFAEFKKQHGLENFNFGENCYFINFNYTETLEKRFHIEEDKIFHIHGQCQDEDVVFGHALHPQEPQHELQQFGGRFAGLYHIETLLYETDKHVQNNIMELCFNLALSGVDVASIKNIFVLGHSLGDADLEYFDFIMDAVSPGRGKRYKEFFKDRIYYDRGEWNEKKLEKTLKKGDSLEEMHLRLQYTIKQYGYRIPGNGYQDYGYQSAEDVLPEEIAAVRKKYGIEQTLANMQLKEQFFLMMEEELQKVFSDSANALDPDGFRAKAKKRNLRERSQAKSDVHWYISCFSEGDRKWAREVMEGLGSKNYQLVSTIDECLRILSDEASCKGLTHML